ncbi:MAG: methyltransferase domain-containing protein [Pyrinomonadaceae bacterium]
MKEINKINTPPYVRYLGRLTGYFPNFDFSFIKPVRRKAVELLNLKSGDRVLDVGCGSGGSFPYLVRAVRASGEVIGVEISPESAKSARRRAAINDWANVEVIESNALDVRLTGSFDGLLMFAAADIYASREALENVLPHLRENARVVAFGAKLSRHRFGRVLNPVLKTLFKLSFTTTPKPDYEPWQVMAEYIERFEIKEYFFGLMFICAGDNLLHCPPSAR